MHGAPMWTRGLASWYEAHGRHGLGWRQTRDPWAILVSEVMLQQTQVSRVTGRWEAFMRRWPDPATCAEAPLPELLREWQGLGYPRRARALHDTATVVATGGWPAGERELRSLPGVGPYTARALRVLGFGDRVSPPLDVNIARVTARAALGIEPRLATAIAMREALDAGRPRRLSHRHFTYALFDAGALHCRAQPRCSGCPLAAGCRSRTRLAQTGAPRSPRRQGIYAGSTRELRGAVLAAMLGPEPPLRLAALRSRVGGAAAARRPGAVAAALTALRREGLLE